MRTAIAMTMIRVGQATQRRALPTKEEKQKTAPVKDSGLISNNFFTYLSSIKFD